jgi:hypothetical protein
MIIKLALKKKTSGKLLDNIIAWAIRIRTFSQYFHVEMVVGDKWISTNPQAGAVYINDLLPLNDKYDYIDVNIHKSKVDKMIKFAEKQVGKKYDWLGILLSQAVNVDVENKDKWFCSEIVAEMLKVAGEDIPKNSNQYSPGDLSKLYS